jgi:glycosyltransferase involved in cell wall biosynthesis
MRFAVLGTRGIPANYGGFETFAEELSTRLAQRGHAVTVYCRGKRPETEYRGVQLACLPTIRNKYFDTLAHAFVSTLHLLAHPVDAALYCNGANALFTALPRAAGMPVALNVDGIERKRAKWNRLAKGWYYFSEWLATFCPSEVITDALAIQRYYRDQWRKESVFIPYGAETGRAAGTATLEKLGLEPGRYFLYVSRMEPENRALEVRQSFEQTSATMKLALVGDAPYAHDYIQAVRNTSDPRLVIPGAIYGEGYRELGSHCFAYIHATEVGGTHPALIEAMGRGALVLYRDTPENSEVASGAGIPFRPEELTAKIELALAMTETERETLRQAAAARVRERYSWDAVTDAYEALLLRLVRAGR